jgi:transcriptional regulator with XRE-family HTH domain
MTKIDAILNERGMSQGDLIRLIKTNTGFKIGRDRISKICTGKLTNYTMETAVMIAEALQVPLDSIVELSNIKKSHIIRPKKSIII